MDNVRSVLALSSVFPVGLILISILKKEGVDIVATLLISAVAAIVKFFVMKLA